MTKDDNSEGNVRTKTRKPPKIEANSQKSLLGAENVSPPTSMTAWEWMTRKSARDRKDLGTQLISMTGAELHFALKNSPKARRLLNSTQPITGFGVLHLAIIANDLGKLRAAIEFEATFFSDSSGRWPSTLAVLLERGDDLCDYIADEEAKFLGLV